MPNALKICKSLDIRCFFKPWPLWRVWIFSTDGVERLSIDESADNIFVGIYSSVAEEGPPTSDVFRASHVYFNDCFCFFVGWCFEKEFALWACNKT